jgi:hypothetical protein
VHAAKLFFVGLARQVTLNEAVVSGCSVVVSAPDTGTCGLLQRRFTDHRKEGVKKAVPSFISVTRPLPFRSVGVFGPRITFPQHLRWRSYERVCATNSDVKVINTQIDTVFQEKN